MVAYKRKEQLGDIGYTLEEYAESQLEKIGDDLFENVGVELEETEAQLKQVLLMMLQLFFEEQNR